jgi:glycosyltransferase involved in cell wall biosynthesis
VIDRFCNDDQPFVSIIMPIRNEANYITRSLQAVLAQDYPHDRLEVIVVDGLSDDGTRDIVQSMARKLRDVTGEGHPTIPLYLLDNPRQIAPTALNIGIRHAEGDIIVRVDGHTLIAPDYVHQCVEALHRTGADNVGGTMRAVAQNTFGQVTALATSTPFGVGGARFHYSDREEWVDTVYLGAWPRAVFARIGLFDEELVRTQDSEFNYRLRKFGGRILHSPRIMSSYSGRTRPIALAKQYFQYGLWKVRVLQKNPRQMCLRQFVPPTLVIALIGSALLALFSKWGLILLQVIGGAYLLANLAASLITAAKNGWRHAPLLPVAFAILHLSWGLGFLVGLLRFWNRWNDKRGQTPAY